MHNLAHVESSEPPHNLNENIQNFLLFNVGLPFLVVTDLLVKVSVISEFHHETQALARVVDKRLFVANDIGLVN